MARSIASLAVVKAVFEKTKGDYIENFVPFIATLIKSEMIKEIKSSDLVEFIDQFEMRFGLRIPHHPMLSILGRAVKRNVVKKSGHLFIPNQAGVLKYDFSDEVVSKEARINQLFDEILIYCRDNGVDVTVQDINDAILAYLKNHDLDILFASQQTTSLLPIVTKTNNKLKFLLFQFVSNARDRNPEQFSTLIDISVGHLLANALVCTNETINYHGKLEGLIVFLDSRFLFRLMGFEGDDYKRAYQELIRSMLEQKAELKVFQHTYDEVMVILSNCLKYIGKDTYNSARANTVLQYFVKKNYSESDVHQWIATLERKLEELNISIQEAPEFTLSSEMQICETTLRSKIIEEYSKGGNFEENDKEASIDRDVKSISSIYHLRKGRASVNLKSSKYIFLTTNSTLAFLCKKFGYDISGQAFYISVCLTDVFVGTLVWMQSPTKWIALNQKKIIANLIAAIKPDKHFIKVLVEKANGALKDGKISDDEYMMINRSSYIQNMFMEKTFGESDAISIDEIEAIFKQNVLNATEYRKQLDDSQNKNEQLVAELDEIQANEDKRSTKLIKIINGMLLSLQLIFTFAFIYLIYQSVMESFAWMRLFLTLLTGTGFLFGFNICKLKMKLKRWALEWFNINETEAV